MKITTMRLLGVLITLIVLYITIDYFGDKSKSKGLRSELVAIDTAAVTQISIIKGDTEVSLQKNEEADWEVMNTVGNYVPAVNNTVERLISTITTVKPSRLVSKNREQWSNYQVASTGTVIKVLEGNKTTLDMVIGRFAVKGQRQFYSFVRLSDEDEVYAADNFMGMNIGTEGKDYRDQDLLSLNKDSIRSIRFDYPLDSGFVLERRDEEWLVDGYASDSTSVTEFVSGLSNLRGSEFYDQAITGKAAITVIVDQGAEGQVTIFAYLLEDQWVFNSTQNSDNYLLGSKLEEKLFADVSKLKLD